MRPFDTCLIYDYKCHALKVHFPFLDVTEEQMACAWVICWSFLLGLLLLAVNVLFIVFVVSEETCGLMAYVYGWTTFSCVLQDWTTSLWNYEFKKSSPKHGTGETSTALTTSAPHATNTYLSTAAPAGLMEVLVLWQVMGIYFVGVWITKEILSHVNVKLFFPINF